MNDEEAQQLYTQFVEQQQQAESLTEHLKQMQEQLKQIEQTEKTISELQAITTDKNTWVTIAPGAYAKATIKPSEHLLLNIGAGVAVEKTPSQVLETLAGHKKILEELQEAALQELKENLEQLEKIRQEVEKAAPEHGGHTH